MQSRTNIRRCRLGASLHVDDDAGNIYGYALGCNGEMAKVGFGPDGNGEFFRYEVADDATNIVFSVTNTYHGLDYSVDYKLNESDDWRLAGRRADAGFERSHLRVGSVSRRDRALQSTHDGRSDGLSAAHVRAEL